MFRAFLNVQGSFADISLLSNYFQGEDEQPHENRIENTKQQARPCFTRAKKYYQEESQQRVRKIKRSLLQMSRKLLIFRPPISEKIADKFIKSSSVNQFTVRR